MGYRKGLVYFIDVLGTKDRSFDSNLLIATQFHKEMKGVQERHRRTSVGDRAVFSFSDCAYLVYALKEEYKDDEETRLKYIYQSLYNTTQTVATFLSNGFLCRGGIVYGDVYFDLNENIIFGPAVNQSYILESKIAIYPNIILEEQLAKEILEFDRSLKLNDPLASMQNGQIILHNELTNQYYLNYLNYLCGVSSVDLSTRAYSFEQLYLEAVQRSEEQIVENEGNASVVKKHRWQIDYLNRVKEMRYSEVEIDPLDLLDLIQRRT